MNDDNQNFDRDRYFSDPEYRKKIAAERKKRGKEIPSESSATEKFSLRKKILIGGLSFILLMGVIASGYVYYLFQGLPSIQELENPQTAIASVVQSRDGVVLDRYFTENRTYVPIEQISPNIVDALIATEDHRFYTHWGIDAERLVGLPIYWLQGRFQGGSTISQQLARNLYRKIGREVSVTRKLREMLTAIQIEQNYTKDEIIEMYLNTVEFANSTYGIESASQTHFGKPAGDISVTEAATLIGMLRAVYAYNPRIFPERSMQRRNVVLRQMMRRGFISENIFTNLSQEEIALNYQPPSRSGRKSRYFGEYVRQKVNKWTEENGYDLYTDGLTVYTTIDSRLQRHAERAVKENLEEFQPQFAAEWTSPGGEYMDRFWEEYPGFLLEFIRDTDRYKNGFRKFDTNQESVVFDNLMADEAFVDSVKSARTKLQGSFVAIDPNNGSVLAWVGGMDYGQQQFDHVYQSKRQAGSTFKPFVYSIAVDNGYMPYHKFSKYPVSFIEQNGRIWNPKDRVVPDGPEMVPLRDALARSLNNVTVRLLPEIAGASGTNRAQDLVPAARKIREMASMLGIDMSNVRGDFPSIALGTANVSLLELVSAYTTFANEGVHIDPIAVTRIEDKEGNVLVEYFPDYSGEAISPETAYIMIDMMRGVIRGGDGYHGTGVRMRNQFNVQQDIAGKTGTSQNSADNWFVAMMPHIVMGSWVGGEDRRIRFPVDRPGSIGQGARTALPIVGTFINYATDDPEAPWSYEPFQPPAGFVMPEDPSRATEQVDEQRGRIGW
ncbi:transglycosylase domain-containing protein [soil metagenome]